MVLFLAGAIALILLRFVGTNWFYARNACTIAHMIKTLYKRATINFGSKTPWKTHKSINWPNEPVLRVRYKKTKNMPRVVFDEKYPKSVTELKSDTEK